MLHTAGILRIKGELGTGGCKGDLSFPGPGQQSILPLVTAH